MDKDFLEQLQLIIFNKVRLEPVGYTVKILMPSSMYDQCIDHFTALGIKPYIGKLELSGQSGPHYSYVVLINPDADEVDQHAVSEAVMIPAKLDGLGPILEYVHI